MLSLADENSIATSQLQERDQVPLAERPFLNVPRARLERIDCVWREGGEEARAPRRAFGAVNGVHRDGRSRRVGVRVGEERPAAVRWECRRLWARGRRAQRIVWCARMKRAFKLRNASWNSNSRDSRLSPAFHSCSPTTTTSLALAFCFAGDHDNNTIRQNIPWALPGGRQYVFAVLYALFGLWAHSSARG